MISWFTRNGVAANLVMLIVVVGGLASLFRTKQELFPQFSLDVIQVRVPYRGASPEDVEQGVVVRIEEAIHGVEGIKEVRSTAREGIGIVSIEVREGSDVSRIKEDIRTRVDAIATFPVETERPVVEELLIQRDVLWVAVYGDADERSLKEMAQRIRDDITMLPGVSQAFVSGVRDYEISIAVSELDLRTYGLTFDEVVTAVRRGSVNLPGGVLRTTGGEILLRTEEQAYSRADFNQLVLRTDPDGTVLRLGDVAEVVDGFTDEPIRTEFNGLPAALILVREVGMESPLEISARVQEYLVEARATWLPEGIAVDTWADASFYLRARLNMLVQNGLAGFVLVLLTLSLFLRPSLAFFVAIGIPVSFLGTFLVGAWLGVSINLISLFAFILVLGIVVDDAIVVGESVFSEYQKNGPGVESSIRGALAVAKPVTFAVLTSMAAFLAIFFLPGQLGKFLAPIPVVVTATLFFSLVQTKLVLPYHLSLLRVGDRRGRERLNFLSRAQRLVSDGLEGFVERYYRPSLHRAMAGRYLTVAIFTAIFVLSIGLLAGGWVRFAPFPSVPSDFIVVDLRMPEGASFQQTDRAVERISQALDHVIAEDLEAGKINPVHHRAEMAGFSLIDPGSNTALILIELAKAEVRDSDAVEVADRWREKIGIIPGARSLTINAHAGPPTGLPVDIRLAGSDFDELRLAAALVRSELETIAGLIDIRDTFSGGTQEIKLRVKPSAHLLGIGAIDLGQQVRAAFFGAEAQRIQRGRDDIRVMVRYPEKERNLLGDLETMRIRTPAGHEIPMSEVADIRIGEGYPTISRVDRQRVIQIQADAEKEVMDFGAVNARIYGRTLSPAERMRSQIRQWRGREPIVPEPSILDQIQAQFPGVRLVKDGEARDWEEARAALFGGLILVFFLIYSLLAIPFRSYLQPLIVMSVIPFGVAGAILGHLITFQSMSILSFLGVIALAGVVVNGSLVMVDFVNRHRQHGQSRLNAVVDAGAARFRPIMLTSLTTFMGLVPILLERSLQAQFLIPMATSLAFGVVFAGGLTLYLVPAIYLILDDLSMAWTGFWRRWWGAAGDEIPESELRPGIRR